MYCELLLYQHSINKDNTLHTVSDLRSVLVTMYCLYVFSLFGLFTILYRSGITGKVILSCARNTRYSCKRCLPRNVHLQILIFLCGF